MRVMIAAAGTGGHVFPGLSVGEALVDLGLDHSDVHYVGGDRLEASIYPDRGFPFHRVELRGLQRSLTAKNLGIPKVVLKARDRIKQILTEEGIGGVLGMGGYVTIPAGLAARSLRVTFFNSEQNANAGLANKVAARWARQTFGAFPRTAGLPNAEWVGNPVRQPFWSFDRSELRLSALETYGLNGGSPVLGVVGGSLGAALLNDTVTELVGEAEQGLQVLHLVGERNLEEITGHETAPGITWVRIGFEADMARFYAASDLVLARAGGAVAELTATGTPSVLVPGPFGSGGHQAMNAAFLADTGAAVVIGEDEMGTAAGRILKLLNDPERLGELSQGAAKIAKPAAATSIAAALVQAAP